MTSPAEQEQRALHELVIALGYAQTAEVVMGSLEEISGVSKAAIKLLFEIPQVRSVIRLAPKSGAHTAVLAMNRLNLIRRAAYLISAARRLTVAARGGPNSIARALVTERRWLQQHLAASAQRDIVANGVASVARQQAKAAKQAGTDWNGLLGWYAVGDARTSPECRAANGRNFDPRKVPLIGFPGAVHPGCRCTSGPPFPGRPRVEEIHPPARAKRVPLPV
jgi:SPP1 gp7 family putative phage head morphogenesis protein